MALTQEQLNRIEELKAEKQEYVRTRSNYYDKKSRGESILNDIQNYWNNALGIDPSPSIQKITWENELRSEFLDDIDAPNTYLLKLLNYVKDIYGNDSYKKYNFINTTIQNSQWTSTDKENLKRTLDNAVNDN